MAIEKVNFVINSLNLQLSLNWRPWDRRPETGDPKPKTNVNLCKTSSQANWHVIEKTPLAKTVWLAWKYTLSPATLCRALKIMIHVIDLESLLFRRSRVKPSKQRPSLKRFDRRRKTMWRSLLYFEGWPKIHVISTASSYYTRNRLKLHVRRHTLFLQVAITTPEGVS